MAPTAITRDIMRGKTNNADKIKPISFYTFSDLHLLSVSQSTILICKSGEHLSERPRPFREKPGKGFNWLKLDEFAVILFMNVLLLSVNQEKKNDSQQSTLINETNFLPRISASFFFKISNSTLLAFSF